MVPPAPERQLTRCDEPSPALATAQALITSAPQATTGTVPCGCPASSASGAANAAMLIGTWSYLTSQFGQRLVHRHSLMSVRAFVNVGAGRVTEAGSTPLTPDDAGTLILSDGRQGLG